MNGHPDERGGRDRTDLLIGVSIPGVLVADAWAHFASYPVDEAFLEAVVATGMFGPVVALAPVVAARRIRSTGMRTPGEIRSGVPRRSPTGSALRNLGLALGWMLA